MPDLGSAGSDFTIALPLYRYRVVYPFNIKLHGVILFY